MATHLDTITALPHAQDGTPTGDLNLVRFFGGHGRGRCLQVRMDSLAGVPSLALDEDGVRRLHAACERFLHGDDAPAPLDASTLHTLAVAADFMAHESEPSDREGRCSAYLRRAADAARAAVTRL